MPTICEFSFAKLLSHLAQNELMNAVVVCGFIFLRWNRYVFGKDFALRLFTGERLCPAGQMVDEATAVGSRESDLCCHLLMREERDREKEKWGKKT